jgi:hypothetical protein
MTPWGEGSENELEQCNHYDQADQEDDANGTAEEFKHGLAP